MSDVCAGPAATWQWCKSVSKDEWYPYNSENNSLIEEAYKAGRAMIDVEVGVRNFTLYLNTGGKMVQFDRKLQKARSLRRRPAEQPTGLLWPHGCFEGATCIMCQQRFEDTWEMPVVKLTCGHFLHSACALPLSERHAPCPVCKKDDIDWITAMAPSMGKHEGNDFATLTEIEGPHKAIFDASFRGDLEKVQYCLRQGVSVNTRSEMNSTPLVTSAMQGHLEVVQALLEANANVQLATCGGRTALWVAGHQEHGQVVDLLLDYKANPYAKAEGTVPASRFEVVATALEALKARGQH